jgi:hypothetical protein
MSQAGKTLYIVAGGFRPGDPGGCRVLVDPGHALGWAATVFETMVVRTGEAASA